MAQITKEALLEKLFQNDYEELKGKRLRLTRVRVPADRIPVFMRIWRCISECTREKTIRENPSV